MPALSQSIAGTVRPLSLTLWFWVHLVLDLPEGLVEPTGWLVVVLDLQSVNGFYLYYYDVLVPVLEAGKVPLQVSSDSVGYTDVLLMYVPKRSDQSIYTKNGLE